MANAHSKWYRLFFEDFEIIFLFISSRTVRVIGWQRVQTFIIVA